LDMIEPWAAAGSRTIAADSNDPEVKAVVLQYETSRLLLVTRIGPHAQYVPKHSTGKTVSFVVPGIPESHDLIELTAGGLRPLSHKRVAGGTLITLEDFDMTGFVLITPDPLMVNVLLRRLAGVAQRTAIWQRELAARTLARVVEVERRLPAEVQDLATSATLLAAAQRDLEEADKNLTAQDRRAAFVASRHAMASLGHLRRQHWMRAANKSRSTAAGPLIASFDMLPEHWQFTAALRDCVEQPNQLPAGDCEDFQTLLRAGWRHVKHPLDGIESTVEVVPGGPPSGQSCLRMEVHSIDPRANATLVESAPVWVTSAAVHLAQGQIVCIRGKVRVPSPVRGSVDGLMIVDSLGGESLAERIGQTNGWEEFALYRAAPCDSDVNVTFALTGYGEAFIDDISIQPVTLVSRQATPGFPQSQSRNAPIQRASSDVGASPNGGPRNYGLPVRQAQRTRQLFSPPRR
jgi:hypothetical protein